MTGKTAMIGDGNSIAVFRAAGVATFPAGDERTAREALRRAAKEYSIIFLTEEFEPPLRDMLKRFDEQAFPAVLVIPSAKGSQGYGEEVLKNAMERALGVDLFQRDGRN